MLVGGYLRGTWETKSHGAQTQIQLRMFSNPSAAVRAGIEAEVQRLAVFMDRPLTLVYV